MLDGRDWFALTGASTDEMAALRALAPIALPEAYFALLEFSNGGEGPLPVQPCNFCLYPAAEAMQIAQEGAFRDSFPGLFVIGGNGGGELIAIDTITQGHPIVYFDMANIDSRESVVSLAPNFDAFVELIGLE